MGRSWATEVLSTWPVASVDDDEVAADDRQAAVGALVGDVLQAGGGLHGLGECVVPADLQARVVAGDQAARGLPGLGPTIDLRGGRPGVDAGGAAASTNGARTVARTPPRTSLFTDTLQGTVDRVGPTHEG